MPKLTPEHRKRRAKKLTKDLSECGFNFTTLAKKYGVSRSAISQRFRNKKNQDVIRKLLDDDQFKRALISVGLEGLSATKVVSAVVNGKDAKDANAATMDFIEVPDLNVRHRYWRDFLKAMGFLGADGINIQIGDKNTINEGNKILIIRPDREDKKIKTVEVEPNGKD